MLIEFKGVILYQELLSHIEDVRRAAPASDYELCVGGPHPPSQYLGVSPRRPDLSVTLRFLTDGNSSVQW